MQRIGAVSGDIINLKTVLLPKAESVRFQPEDDVWYSIDEEERKAVLEFELRRHQFLEANSTLQIPYLGKTHALHVRKIVPESAAAVSIMDTDLSTEVMEQSVQNDRTKQEDKEEEEEDTSIIREESGALTVHLNKGEYSFCKFFVEDVSKLYVVEANGHQQQGIDMYISSQTQHPTHQDFQFASQCEERTMVELSDSHPSFAPTTFYVGVRIRDSKDSGKSISLSMKAKARKSSSADAKKVGYVLGTTRRTSGDDDGGHKSGVDNSSSSNLAQCQNCRRMIPRSSLTMHEMQCSRRNVFCDKCQVVVPKRHFQRHMELIHSPMKCLACNETCRDQGL